ncbi:MAG: YHS domain-containing protein, partial [Acidobacteriota bacterium]
MEHLDPVCGMKVDPASAAGHDEFEGQSYYFCHPGCRERFKADPRHFLDPATPRLGMPGMQSMTPVVQLGGRSRTLPVLSAPAVATAIDPV